MPIAIACRAIIINPACIVPGRRQPGSVNAGRELCPSSDTELLASMEEAVWLQIGRQFRDDVRVLVQESIRIATVAHQSLS